MSNPKHKQILEWLDAVVDGLETSANNVEMQANSVKPGFIITLTHAIPSDEPTTLPTPPQAQTSTSNTRISGVSAPTPLTSNLAQLEPSSAVSPPPPSVSPVSPASSSASSSASSPASSLSSASSISTGSQASTPPPLLVASPSTTPSVEWPTGLSAAPSITLPYLPSTTFATQPIGSRTSLAGLPATANPNNSNNPSEENKGSLTPPVATEEVRDSSRAIGIVFGSLSKPS